MHEIKLVKDIIDILEKEVKDLKVKKIKEVHLEIGRLKYLTPDTIISCFKHLPKSKKLADVKIKIKMLPGNELRIKRIEW